MVDNMIKKSENLGKSKTTFIFSFLCKSLQYDCMANERSAKYLPKSN